MMLIVGWFEKVKRQQGMAVLMNTGLESFFSDAGRVALAFSGGADSSFLLYSAVSAGADVIPYFVSTEFCRKGDRAHAEEVSKSIGTDLKVISLSMLDDPRMRENPADRCYLCKRRIFSVVKEAALRDGCSVVVDGTNASDDEGDRPGMRALRELGIRSPLREAGITKETVRERSRAAGLSTWDLPSNSCLATRVPAGTELSADILSRVEGAEDALRDLGFDNTRVRIRGDGAVLEFRSGRDRAVEEYPEVEAAVKPFFNDVCMKGRE